MKRGIIGIIIAVVALVLVGYFFMNSSSNDKVIETESSPETIFQTTPESTNVSETIVEEKEEVITAKTYNIEIKGFAFVTPSITINVGDTIIWTNKDSVAHTVTSDSGKELDSELFGKDKTYSHTFNQTGTYSYYCIPHPSMKGKVIVQ